MTEPPTGGGPVGRASSLEAGDPVGGSRLMRRDMLRAKVHRIRVTERDVEYEGSLSLDSELMQAAGMLPFERVEVYDVDNGNRFATYLIEAAPGSGDCCVNGAAARLVELGDKLILASYASLDEDELADHRPQLVLIGEDNRISRCGRSGVGRREGGSGRAVTRVERAQGRNSASKSATSLA